MEEKINAMSAAEALREWKYARRQISPTGSGGKSFQKSVQKLAKLTNARLSELWKEHEIHPDAFGQIYFSLAKYDPKELEALLIWHNSK